jgi:hypothetical protein
MNITLKIDGKNQKAVQEKLEKVICTRTSLKIGLLPVEGVQCYPALCTNGKMPCYKDKQLYNVIDC